MMENTISVTMRDKASGGRTILSEVSPKQAIEEYLLPDTYPPVAVLIIEATDTNGKKLKLWVSDTDVSFEVE